MSVQLSPELGTHLQKLLDWLKGKEGKPLLAVDVGGSGNPRFFIGVANKGVVYAPYHLEEPPFQILRTNHQCNDLLNSIKQVIKQVKTKTGRNISHAVFDFAGPVSKDRQKVEVTNWRKPRIIKSSDLKGRLGGNNGNVKILMLNDIEAAAYGLISLELASKLKEGVEELYTPRNFKWDKLTYHNKVMSVAGRGHGTVQIVTLRTKEGFETQPVASEIQHALSAPQSELQEAVQQWFKRKGHDLRNESFVSGPGLEMLYEAVCNILNRSALPEIQSRSSGERAKMIAGNASSSKPDLACVLALSLFYQFCGQAMQALALACKPYGGIFLAGRHIDNHEFIFKRQDFVKALQSNPSDLHRSLLCEFPIFLLKKDWRNPNGNVEHAHLHLRGDLFAAVEREYLML